MRGLSLLRSPAFQVTLVVPERGGRFPAPTHSFWILGVEIDLLLEIQQEFFAVQKLPHPVEYFADGTSIVVARSYGRQLLMKLFDYGIELLLADEVRRLTTGGDQHRENRAYVLAELQRFARGDQTHADYVLVLSVGGDALDGCRSGNVQVL